MCFVCVFKSQPPVPAPLAVPSFSSVFVSTSKKNDDSDKCLVIITDPCVCVSSTICFLSLPPSFGCVASLFPFSNWNDSLLVSTKTQLRQHQFIVRRRKRTRTDERGNVLPVCVTRTTCNNILCLIISFQFVFFSNCRLFYLSVQRGREKKKKMVE